MIAYVWGMPHRQAQPDAAVTPGGLNLAAALAIASASREPAVAVATAHGGLTAWGRIVTLRPHVAHDPS